jgi:hypothetical protein
MVTCAPPNTYSFEFGCPNGSNSDDNGAWVVVSCASAANGNGIDVAVTGGISDHCVAQGPNVDVQSLVFENVLPGMVSSPQVIPNVDPDVPDPGSICACTANLCDNDLIQSCSFGLNSCAFDNFQLGSVSVANIGGF